MRWTGRCLGLAAIVLVMLITPAYASIMGDTVRIEWLYPNSSTVLTSTDAVVVDPGVEWYAGFGAGNIDIRNGLITIENLTMGWTAAAFNGFTFSDLTKNANFTSFDLVSVTGNLPPNNPVLAFSSNLLSVNFGASGASSIGNGQVYTFSYTTGSVPEPATALLLGAGLVGAGIMRMRKKFAR